MRHWTGSTWARRVAYPLGVAGIGMLAQNCSGSDIPTDDVSLATQAVSAPDVTTSVALGFDIEGSSQLPELVLAADEYMRLADRVELQSAAVVGSGSMEVGNDAKVATLRTSGNLSVGHRSVVSGDVIAGADAQLQETTSVTGAVQESGGALPPVGIHWTVKAPTNSLGNVSLEPDLYRDLQPGRFADLSVKSGATLTLHTGVYAFDSIQLEPDSIIQADDGNGPIQIIVQTGCTFRGRIVSTTGGIPQVLFAVQGSQDVFVEAPFEGVMIAPNATIRFQAAQPEGHRALAFGKSIWLEPDTKIRRLPFNWGAILGPAYAPRFDNAPLHEMLGDNLNLTLRFQADNNGTAKKSVASVATSRTFTLPETYTIAGGIIGNGTAVVRFNDGSSWNSCTYRGMSSTCPPVTAEELIKGSVLKLESCTDGLPASTSRSGKSFEFEVTPCTEYAATVQSPLQRTGACSEKLEVLTPEQTREMRAQFNWSTAQKVAPTNSDGSPTLYYAWAYIRNKEDALALKKLYIHVLSHPLFDAELMQYAGRCGTFTNPGDGAGMFVPAVIPGKTYNRLIDALTSSEVTGDRVILDAVIIREVPTEARNPNGSINLQVLGQSGFRYLSYDVNALRPTSEIVLDGSKVSRALVGVLEWVVQAAYDVSEEITGLLNEIDQLFRGEVTVSIFAHAITHDELFRDQVIVRGWGSQAGQPLGANGMQVKILQKLFGSPIPTTAQARTDRSGYAWIDATKNSSIRGRGLCIELRNDAAMVTDFLVANELCDLRAYDDNKPNKQVGDFQLDTLTESTELRLHIDNTQLVGFYQSDDVHQYALSVMGYEARRARILAGYWANTFMPTRSEDGLKQLMAPCLNFPNSLTEAIFSMAGAAGTGTGAAIGAGLGSIIPGLGNAVGAGAGALIGGIAAGTFAAVVGNSDIVMPDGSRLEASRSILSHEYGHYLFCNMLYDANPSAIDHLVWGNVVGAGDGNFPLRYMNEAMADYFAGQVASSVTYNWLDRSQVEVSASLVSAHCEEQRVPCWDSNLTDNGDMHQNIGRVATMLMDLFDGQSGPRASDQPSNGDAWRWNSSTLAYSPTGDGNDDSNLERVALPGYYIGQIAADLAAGMRPFIQYNLTDGNFEGAGYAIDDMKIRTAVDNAMLNRGINWCGRCAVLALHEPGGRNTTVRELWETCQTDPDLVEVLGPSPDPVHLRLDADTCSVCGAGFISDDNGACVPCADTVVGNRCEVCGPDVVLDGQTMAISKQQFDVSSTQAGDTCPDDFVVEVQNAQALFSRGAVQFGAQIVPSNSYTRSQCEREHVLRVTYNDPAGNGAFATYRSTGSWLEGGLFPCQGLPVRDLTSAELGAGSVRFSAPALSGSRLEVVAATEPYHI